MDQKKEKQSLASWFENIWWYYKWIIIIGGCVVVFLLIALTQLFSKHEGDVNLLYIGPGVLTVKENESLQEFVSQYVTDVNGDGRIEVGLLELTAQADSAEAADGEHVLNYDTNNAVLQRFNNEVRMGDSHIFFVDEYYYEHYLVDTGLLCTLESLLTPSQMPERTKDEYGVYLKDLGLKEAPGFSVLPGDTVVCFRRSPENDELKYGHTIEAWNANRHCFISLITHNSSAVKYDDMNVGFIYYGEKRLTENGLFYLKRWINNNVKPTSDYGDTVYSFTTVAPPIIISGDESQAALTEAELYAKLIETLVSADGSILLVDKAYIDLALKYGEFEKLSDHFTDKEIPAYEGSDADIAARLEYAFPLEWIDARYMDGLSELDESTYICITSGENTSDSVEVIKKLLSYEYKGSK